MNYGDLVEQSIPERLRVIRQLTEDLMVSGSKDERRRACTRIKNAVDQALADYEGEQESRRRFLSTFSN